MNQLLVDLYGHQAWADAEHWRAFESYPTALDDQAIRDRLHHYHQTHRAFLFIAKNEPMDVKQLMEVLEMPALKESFRRYHESALDFIRSVSNSRLKETAVVPWFKDTPLNITVEQALVQAAMHSHYHRGQNASRFRELGGTPPLTDLILWFLKGKPEARWI